MTPEERQRARMPPTNDHNEGKLGTLRSKSRANPNMSMHHFNALIMFKSNDTAAFAHHMLKTEDHAYVYTEARKRDSSHLEEKRKAAIVAFKHQQVVGKRSKQAHKAQEKSEKEARLAEIQRIEAVEDVSIKMTNDQLRDQLDIYRTLVNAIPLKSHLKTKAELIKALKEAIGRYRRLGGAETPES